MKFLKGLALSLLSLLLFLSLSVFGLAFMLNNTILNPDFIAKELDNLNVSSLTEEIISGQVAKGEFPEELGTAVGNTVTKLEPLMKEQVNDATHSIYDYLLGKKPNPELTSTLRNTVLSKNFIVSLVDELDMPSLAGGLLKKQLSGAIPKGMESLSVYLDKSLDDTLTKLEPWIKEQLSIAADPVLDYLVGKSKTLNVSISLQPVKDSLKDSLWQAFLQSPPPELAGVPQSVLKPYFDGFYQTFAAQTPSTFVLNESLLGTTPAQITKALADAEIALEQARQYIGDFQLYYKALIGFMVLLILGIILINRQVKGATRKLGTIFLTYGAFEYAGVFLAKHFAGAQLTQLPSVPSSLKAWLPQLTGDFLAPLEMFSLGILIGGIALLVVSFVYKPRQTEF